MISSVRADAFLERPSAGAQLTARKAVMRDIPAILALISGYAAQGIMLPRTEFEMSEAIRDFTVVERAGEFLGCGALHFYSPTVGEIRSLAVREKAHGAGRRLVEALLAEAQIYELGAVFAFTYVVEFFNKVGFHVVERGVLPLKAWKDCLRCTKCHACDETAMLRILRPEHWCEGSQPQSWATEADSYIQLPTPQQV